MTPYAGLGMWVWETSQTNADALCARLAANKFWWVVVKAHDGTSEYNGSAEIEAYRAAAHKHGLKFGIWGYLTAQDPVREAAVASSLCSRHGADFYVADAEVEYERSRGASRSFVGQFRRDQPHLPAAFSTFGRVDFHSAIDYPAWVDGKFDFMPQAYECESSMLTPAACIAAAEKFWHRGSIYPTLGTYAGARGLLSGQQLYDSVRGISLPGVNVWDAQELHPGQIEALSHLTHGTVPPPPGKLPPHIHKLMFPMDPKAALHLTSPLTRSTEVHQLQQAINIAHDKNTPLIPSVQTDGVYGPATAHAGAMAAFYLGLIDTSMSKQTIQRIWHPWLRNPVERKRGNDRIHKANQQPKGLANLPVIAAKYIGIAENPPGSNTGHPEPTGWEENFGMNGVSWCGCFAGSMILLAGGHVTSRVAYCPYIEADAHIGAGGFDRWTSSHADAGPGWLVLYCWDGSGTPEHVGIVESLHSDHLVAIEGNTSGTNPSDGGMVARMSRSYGPVVGYARPRL